MVILYLGLVGLLTFVSGAAILGSWLRRNRSKENAEKSSRVMHFLFFAGLVLPATVALVVPGISRLDELTGLHPLSPRMLFMVSGLVLLVPGLYLMVVSNRLLGSIGKGANAFRLTKGIVENDIYRATRNPMSLGFYLVALSIGLLSRSTFLTASVLFALVPAHMFFLKYFEELELELRFGAIYSAYRREVPFLIPRLFAR